MTISLTFNPPVIAHRGASAYAPENTLIAFIKAVQLGIKWIEFDVLLAACGEPIIFHDEDLNRTTNHRGELKHLSYAYLATLDAGKWFDPIFSGERIPSLKQGIDFLKQNHLCANIEIKPLLGQDEQTAIKALALVEPMFPQPSASILFSSFSVESLRALRLHSPDCLLGLLLHDWESDWEYICESLNCVSVHVNQEVMTKEMAFKIKGTGRILLCYTVNDPVRAQELYSWGVDAVFSDNPDLIVNSISVP